MRFAQFSLKELSKNGICLGIVSNKAGDLLRAECDHLGWTGYFSKIIGANDAQKDKPFADPLLLCLDGLNILPSHRTWYVGDATTDIECARNAGVTGVLVKDLYVKEDFDSFQPDLYFENLRKLTEFVT